MEQRQLLSAKRLYAWERDPSLPAGTDSFEQDFPESSGLRARAAEALLARGARLSELPDTPRSSLLAQSWRSQQFIASYMDLSRSFSVTGIPHVPLKGIWMSREVLRNPSLRFCADLDVWIEKSSLRAAKRVLAALGYREVNRAHNRVHFHHAFRAPSGGPMLELHTALAINDFTRIPSREIWERTTEGGTGLSRELAPEDQLVYIFYHSALHLFDRPARLLDLTDTWAWAEKRGIDPKTLLPRAVAWQCRRLFLLSAGACGWMMDRELLGGAAEEEARNLFHSVAGKMGRRRLRALLADGPWPLVRGILHPRRILGGVLDRLEAR